MVEGRIAHASDAAVHLARQGPGQAIQESNFINRQSSIVNPAKLAKARRREGAKARRKLRAGGED